MSDRATLCQTCREFTVSTFLALGLQPACSYPADAEEAAAERSWPLDLGVCSQCSLVQVVAPVSERILFAGDYHHLAGLTAGYRQHLRGLADELAKLRDAADDGPGPRRRSAVEIGSNDGSLLDELAERDFDVLGIDPVGSESPGGSPFLPEFFGSELASRLAAERGPADIVLALNVFAHATDLRDVLDGVTSILARDGMFVSESHYLPDLLKDLQYDFAYHEHSRYYSLTALQAVFALHGLEVFHIERIPTHGGSIRVFAGFSGARQVDDSVTALRAHEDTLGLTGEAVYRDFAARVEEHRDRLRALIAEVRSDGSRVAAASSPARAVTLLNYCSLGRNDLEFVSEISPRKIGKLSPGTHVPVVGQDRLTGPDQPEYALLLSWHIVDELIGRLRQEGFRGKFIIPLPEPQVIEG